MDFMKVVVFLLFGLPALCILAAFIAIAGVLGAGSAVLVSHFVDNVWASSAIGGALAAIGFYLFYNGLARVLSSTPNPPFKNYAFGGVAYFVGTLVGVPVGAWLAQTALGLWLATITPLGAFVAPSLVTGAVAFGLFYLAEKVKLVKLFPSKAEKPDDEK
jgi:hypothetical protein